MNTRNQEQLNQLPKEMLVQLYLQMDSALDTIMEQNRKITEQNERQAHQIEALQENLAVLVQNRFGRKTEKVKQTDGQYSLDFDTMTLVLNEAEQLTENGPAAEPEAETVIVCHSPRRSKGKMERDLQSVPTMDQDCTLSEEVLATWMIRVSERYFSLLYDRMHQKLLESRLVHCDETPFVVVQNGKSSGTKDYMWVYHTGQEHGSPPVYLYQYSPTRKTENPRNFPERLLWDTGNRRISDIPRTGKRVRRGSEGGGVLGSREAEIRGAEEISEAGQSTQGSLRKR